MNDVTQTAATANQAASTEETGPSTLKEAIYVAIGEYVKNKTQKRIGKTGGREIFDMVVEQVFAAAVRDGSFRFNGGFGSLHVKTYQAGSRRLPSGASTTFGERKKVRYEQGLVVSNLIENGGDLATARRSSVDPKPAEEAKPAAEAKPAEAKKADKKAVAETKKADKKTSQPSAPPAAAGEGSVDLD